ncbi:MAG: hotdog domain-containing protein [Acidobacteriota bacterium]
MSTDNYSDSQAQQQTIRDAAIRLTMMPRDTNAHGTVFGGVILSYIDVAGGVEAVRHTHHERFVTVAMKEVLFHEPVFIGDLVSFYAETIRVGTTSITIHVDVEAERFGNKGQKVRVTEADVTFVAINEAREKVKIGA